MTSRTISKQLGAMEDLTTGVGPTSQSRGGSIVTVNKVDIAFAVSSIALMQDLDINRYVSAKVFSSEANYIEYRYDSAAVTGIVSNTGPGRWVQVALTVATVNLSAAPEYADEAAAVIGGLVTGDLYTTVTGELRIKL